MEPAQNIQLNPAQEQGIVPMETMAKPIEKPVKNQTRSTKRKRCAKGKRRNPKTKRCRKKCKNGYKRNKTGSRCVKN